MSRDAAIAQQMSLGARPSANLAAPNTNFPQRPNYSRAPRPDDLKARTVSAAARSFDGAPVEAADCVIKDFADLFEAHLDSIDANHYSPDGLKDQIAGYAQTDAFKAIAPAVQRVHDQHAAAAANVDAVKAALSPDGDTAAELRASRYWARTSRTFDSITDGSKMLATASDLIGSASREELGTLLQELPSYLQSRGQASAEWMDRVVAQAVPELADAQATESLAAKARDVTDYNAKQITDRVNKTNSPDGYRRPKFVPTSAVR